MKQLTGQDLYEALGEVSDRHVLNTLPPSYLTGKTGAPAKGHRASGLASFFLDNGWVAAVLSAVVTVGVIVALVMAGRSDPLLPPVSTHAESILTDAESLPPETAPTDAESLPPETVPTDAESLPPETEGETWSEDISPLPAITEVPSGCTVRDGVTQDFHISATETRRLKIDYVDINSTSPLAPATSGVLLQLLDEDGSTVLDRRMFVGLVSLYRITDPDGRVSCFLTEMRPAKDEAGTPYIHYAHADIFCRRDEESGEYRLSFRRTGQVSVDVTDHATSEDNSYEYSLFFQTLIDRFQGGYELFMFANTDTLLTSHPDFEDFRELMVLSYWHTVTSMRLREHFFAEMEIPDDKEFPDACFESHGDGTCSFYYRAVQKSTTLIIPGESPTGDIVTVIAELQPVLEGTHVVLPDSVTTIADMAFYTSKENLTSIQLGSGLRTIGEYAFEGCRITSVELPDGLESIGLRAFSDTTLRSITIPDSVTELGESAFSRCGRLVSVQLGSGVTVLPKALFAWCDSLTDIQFSENLTTIGALVFNHDKALTSITFPDSLSVIGSNAFLECASLSDMTLPAGLTMLGESAFSGCEALTGTLRIPDQLLTIENYTFQDCSGLSGVSIPESVKSIGIGAFANCTQLTAPELHDGIRYIGAKAFSGCKAFTTVKLPANLSTVGEGCFMKCQSLAELTVPKSLTSLPANAFTGCKELSVLRFNGTKAEWRTAAQSFGEGWDEALPAYKVYCTDGELTFP